MEKWRKHWKICERKNQLEEQTVRFEEEEEEYAILEYLRYNLNLGINFVPEKGW